MVSHIARGPHRDVPAAPARGVGGSSERKGSRVGEGFDRTELTRRESQIMRILFRREAATAVQVQEDLPDPPGYSSVRKLLEILERKGHVEHEREGRRYVYRPVVPVEEASRSVLRQVVGTFFQGSVEDAVAALLEAESARLSDEELDRIAAMAERARREGR